MMLKVVPWYWRPYGYADLLGALLVTDFGSLLVGRVKPETRPGLNGVLLQLRNRDLWGREGDVRTALGIGH